MLHLNRFTSLLASFLLIAIAVIALTVRAADAPRLDTVNPETTTLGTMVRLTGINFTNSNLVDWGFGRQSVHATGNPGNTQTIDFRLGTQCEGASENPCGSPPAGGFGLAHISVSNANGTSTNQADVFIKEHAHYCYFLNTAPAEPTATRVDCAHPTCNIGSCVDPEPDPTPTPTPVNSASPTPTPTPTPLTTSSTKKVTASSGQNSQVAGVSTTTGSRSGPSASDRAAADFIPNHKVVVTVEKLYRQVFGRPTSACTSHYWKIRARSDKATHSKLLGAMTWQKLRGRDPIFRSCKQGNVPATSSTPTPGNTSGPITRRDINRLYRQIHNGQNPTSAVNQYWISRLKDKPTADTMLVAMQWHQANNTGY